MLFIGILVRIRNVHRSDTLLWPPHHLMLNQIKALMHSDSSIMAMKVDIYHTVDLYDNIKHSYLKECHVGAIIAIVLVIVCVVDKRTVFFWNTITCRDTSFKHVFHERHNLSLAASWPDHHRGEDEFARVSKMYSGYCQNICSSHEVLWKLSYETAKMTS